MIGAISPIIVTLLARLLLKEPCGIFNGITLTVALFGTVIIMEPPFLFSALGLSEIEDKAISYRKHHFFTAAIVLLGTVMGALATVTSRSLKVNNWYLA